MPPSERPVTSPCRKPEAASPPVRRLSQGRLPSVASAPQLQEATERPPAAWGAAGKRRPEPLILPIGGRTANGGSGTPKSVRDFVAKQNGGRSDSLTSPTGSRTSSAGRLRSDTAGRFGGLSPAGSGGSEASSLLQRRAAGQPVARRLSIETDSTLLCRGHRAIRSCRNFNDHYELGKVVMPSCHRDMEIRFATKAKPTKDGPRRQFVVKVRRKPGSFSSPEDEKAWRSNTELVLNLPDVPGIARIDEVLEDAAGYYVVMEKVEGHDLHETLHATGTLPLEDIKEILRQLLIAVGEMHARGCIHKDLKLENVMLDRSSSLAQSSRNSDRSASTVASTPTNAAQGGPGLVKLVDFDTVEDWSPKSPKATRVLGTDQYIAPEAYEGKYSPASDIFAIGVIAYRMLANSFPFKDGIFDDKPGENWVGSPKMKEIRGKLEMVRVDWQKANLMSLPEKEREGARRLIARMLSVREEQRPTASEALQDAWFASRSGTSSPATSPKIVKAKSAVNLTDVPGGGGHLAWSLRAVRRAAATIVT